ncbi:MAG: 5'-methylthioadenosine/S-adenosylhomocysteine nucleosidase, partial [Ramlibacter sp.]
MNHGFRTLAAICILALAGCASSPAAPDTTPRIAIISAFPAELALLQSQVEQPRKTAINGVEFTTGVLQGKPVVLFLSGISMTNAAMNTQLALDHFKVSHIVVSGIAGGVNPNLNIGDVTVARRWGQYLEVVMARETRPGQYTLPPWMKDSKPFANYGMLHPQTVGVRSAGHAGEEKKFWFDTDPALLKIAEGIRNMPLEKCEPNNVCLVH